MAGGRAQENLDERALHTAKRVVHAILRRDAIYLTNVADGKQISFGFDEDPMSTAQFRTELRQKKGIYCVFFHDLQRCQPQPGQTIEELIRESQPVRFRVVAGEGEKYARGIAVYRSGESKTELFTLWFHCRSEQCRLYYLECM